MAFSPYQTAVVSEYTPLTTQEILMPAIYMAEQEQKRQDELEAIRSELDKSSIMAMSMGQDAQDAVNTYRASLNQVGENLYKHGITPATKQAITELRNMYSQNVMPVNVGFAKKEAYYKRESEVRDKDASWRSPDRSNMTYQDWAKSDIASKPLEGASGAVIQAQITAALTPFSKYIDPTSKEKNYFIELLKNQFADDPDLGMYIQHVEKYGYDPESEEGKVLFNTIKDKVYQKLGVYVQDKNGQLVYNPIFTPEDIGVFDASADLARSSMMGETKMQTERNPAATVKMEELKYAMQAALKGKTGSESGIDQTVPPTATTNEHQYNEGNATSSEIEQFFSGKLDKNNTRLKQLEKEITKDYLPNDDDWFARNKNKGENEWFNLIQGVMNDVKQNTFTSEEEFIKYLDDKINEYKSKHPIKGAITEIASKFIGEKNKLIKYYRTWQNSAERVEKMAKDSGIDLNDNNNEKTRRWKQAQLEMAKDIENKVVVSHQIPGTAFNNSMREDLVSHYDANSKIYEYQTGKGLVEMDETKLNEIKKNASTSNTKVNTNHAVIDMFIKTGSKISIIPSDTHSGKFGNKTRLVLTHPNYGKIIVDAPAWIDNIYKGYKDAEEALSKAKAGDTTVSFEMKNPNTGDVETWKTTMINGKVLVAKDGGERYYELDDFAQLMQSYLMKEILRRNESLTSAQKGISVESNIPRSYTFDDEEEGYEEEEEEEE